MLTAGLFFMTAAAAGWALTGVVRRYALARALLDVPNERSSHLRPTPRGGGLAIAIVVLASTAAGWALGLLALEPALAVAGGCLLVGMVGWIDDNGHVPARWRFLAQCAAASWAVFWLGGWSQLRLGFAELSLGPAGSVLAILAIVWCTNLFNFMDGIDGLAASQATIVGILGGGLLLASGSSGLGAISWAVGGASLGFLAWNWAPARIFMGDVGSGLLGFCFAILAVGSDRAGAVPVLVWMLLLGVFAFDASTTLLRRWNHGKRWYEAHREHAYQRAVQAGYSHRRVSVFAAAVTGILALLAFSAWIRPRFLLPAIAAGAVVLTVTYLWVERRSPMEPGSPCPPKHEGSRLTERLLPGHRQP